MKSLKYTGAIVCVLLILGTLPSVFIIAKGIVVGQAEEPVYFVGKLIAYVVLIILLAILSMKLFRSAQS